MASNALPETPLTGDETLEGETEATETQPEGETSPESEAKAKDDAGIEPPAGNKSWEQALQRERERNKQEKTLREQAEQRADDLESRIRETERSGLDETERLRLELEDERRTREGLEAERDAENLKTEFRSKIASKRTQYPKTVDFLIRQMDRNIYPVQGQTWDEIDENFELFASDYEGISPTQESKPTGSNPAYTPPEEVDITTLNAKDLRKILPIADK